MSRNGGKLNHLNCNVAGDNPAALPRRETTGSAMANDSPTVFPGAKRTLHQGFADPDRPELDAEALIAVFRQVRDENGEYCRNLLQSCCR